MTVHTVRGGYRASEWLWGLLNAHGDTYTRGTWQSASVALKTLELGPVVVEHRVSDSMDEEQRLLQPDLPWSEDHFNERVGGLPLNPAPSFRWWPWHSAGHADDHVSAGVFDHTYPERYWPRYAGPSGSEGSYSDALFGIRGEYGDLDDVIAQLARDPFTRQAYLPVWFPEDTGSRNGQRVPCSLGYHFIRSRHRLDVHYSLRSCDLTRHFRNDLYLTARLLQWVAQRVRDTTGEMEFPIPGTIYMTIHNLHVFEPDFWRYS